MQFNTQYSRKKLTADELETQLILKDLQLRSLFNITQAINDNVSISGLYNMYKEFISWEMNVGSMVLFSIHNEEWNCVCTLNTEPLQLKKETFSFIYKKKGFHSIKPEDPSELQQFRLIVPVYHKENLIAVSLIGDFNSDQEIHTKVQFIRAITNIISVAIENKKLFKLTLEQEKYNRDLELASQVQQWLLPSSLPINYHCTAEYIYTPHNNVGGDYLDFIPYNDHCFFVCIADISGKGVAAAILMSNFQALLKSIIHNYSTLDQLVIALNSEIESITKSDKFITFFIAFVNTEKKNITYVNAGHNPPILFKRDSLYRLSEGCIVLGATEQIKDISVDKCNYDENDLLLLFTDGLVDIRNEFGEFYNINRVNDFASKNKNHHIKDFMTNLQKDIEIFKHTQPYPDDIAVLGLKF